jgi:Uma2 family endonuclease
MSTVILPAAYRLTYADWLRLPDDGRISEIIDGDLFVTPTSSIQHQRISRKIAMHVAAFLERSGRGELFYAPTGVRISDDSVVEPDLLVVLQEHRDRIGDQVIDGPPDIVVEILSPGTARRDLVTKREIYSLAGIPEYWIVDSEAANVEVLVLERGAYSRAGLYRRAEALRSPLLPDLDLPLTEIFAEMT